MTERTEIERLLNQTGRTLEGLPGQYDDIAVTKRIREVTGSYRWAGTSALLASHSLHQSDVIELLVGALRDALNDRDVAISELKLISHCATCSNQMPNESGICVNSGGGGAPFMACPMYVWDKAIRKMED